MSVDPPLSVSALKAALSSRGIDCSHCIEKRELQELLSQSTMESNKRQRTLAATGSREVSTVPATGSREVSTAECRAEELVRRLVGELPPELRRLKEPDPSLIFAEHSVPPIPAGELRLCTLNLLDDSRVAANMGGIHAVWEVRRVNVLRCLAAIDADAFLFQELNAKSVAFLTATLAHEYTLVTHASQGGVGVLYRQTPRPGRAVHLRPHGAPSRRTMARGGERGSSEQPGASSAARSAIGVCLHVPLMVHGLEGHPPCPIILSSTHLTLMQPGVRGPQLLSCNKAAQAYSAYLGRDLLRLPSTLPAIHATCPPRYLPSGPRTRRAWRWCWEATSTQGSKASAS